MSACKVVVEDYDLKDEKKASVHKLRDAFEELNQLQKEHRERIKVCEEDIEKYKKFKNDYIHLQKRINSLPNKTSHEVMVPIGSLAFMPGRLVHTNEITVLLGDNWFVERSSKQAAGIISRRIRDVDDKVQSTENVCNLHKNWLKETEELSHGNSGEQVEIIEGPFDEQEVQISRDETKRKLKEYNKKMKETDMGKKKKETDKKNNKTSKKLNKSNDNVNVNRESSTNKINSSEDTSHDDLMNRLDQLYLEEQNNRELESDNDIEDEDEVAISNDQVGKIKIDDVEESESEDLTEESEDLTEESTDEDMEYYENKEEAHSERPQLKRRVSFADEKPPYETVIPDNNSEDIFRIKYISSKLYNVDGESTAVKIHEDSKSGCVNINSPSDLYKAFNTGSSIPLSPSYEDVVASHDIASSPKGILKKSPNRSLQKQNILTDNFGWRYATESIEAATEESGDIIARPPTPPRHNHQNHSQIPSEKDEDDCSLQPAIKYSIVARDDQNDNLSGPVKNAEKATDSSNSEPKKVSRFKASRINKK